MKKVTIRDVSNNLRLDVVSGEEFLDRVVVTPDVSRPGLELTGYFYYYPAERIQLLGRKEITFAERMSSDERLLVMRRLCTDVTPAIIVAHSLDLPEELKLAADEKSIPILKTKLSTSRLSSILSSYLSGKLADRSSIHGVLLEVYGLGVLIQGDSGIGKSETGLELIKKGHRLIADDRVDVYQEDERTVIGEPPKILEHLIEIRGVGIIDVMNLFGVSAVRQDVQIQLVVYLENWSDDKTFDRLGSGEEFQRIANVDVPKIRIPVKPGRNVAIIIESAAMNFRARSLGYDATKQFEESLTQLIQENSDDE